jgi:hypothetical protein
LKGRKAADDTDKLANTVEGGLIESQIDCSREITKESQHDVDIQRTGG